MAEHSYPRSPKVLVGGIAHLARFIDKIRLRNAGLIQGYNYITITVGLDKHLRFPPHRYQGVRIAGVGRWIRSGITGLDLRRI